MRPVFVDIDPATWTVDARAVEAAITPKTRAILACHTFGNPCDEEVLEAVSAAHGIDLVVDAAHGFGSLAGGEPVASRGIAQVFSMSPTKLVVSGEGGIVATRDARLVHAIREAREYGNDGSYGCRAAGLNGRLPEISAALGRASLARLPEVRKRRSEAAAAYMAGLSGVSGVAVQQIASGCESSWKDFTIRVAPQAFGRSRDDLRTMLAARGVDTRAYYSPACHAMEAFAGFHAGRPPLPHTDCLSSECLALPMGRHVSPEVASRVAAMIAEAAR
jgi:dTDP-4-amino-4,6-dideoxygalactose transaminase